MNIYSVNWNVLADNYLPRDLRKPLTRASAKACLLPLTLMHAEFLQFRSNCLYKVRHNSQIPYMEAVLNDMFDNSLRRIRIVNNILKEPIYLYDPEEAREVFLYNPEDDKPVFFRDPDEFAGDGVDFFVMVPPDLQPAIPAAEQTLLTRMRAQIDYYKLYSKNYTILWEQAEE